MNVWVRRAGIALVTLVLLLAVWHLITDAGNNPLCPVCQSGLAMLLALLMWLCRHVMVGYLATQPSPLPVFLPQHRATTRAPPGV